MRSDKGNGWESQGFADYTGQAWYVMPGFSVLPSLRGKQHLYLYVEAIHEALQRRTIGDIKTISIMEHRFPFLDKVKQWNKFSKYSGGTLVEKCCHYFDLMNLFAGARPVSVVYAVNTSAGPSPSK